MAKNMFKWHKVLIKLVIFDGLCLFEIKFVSCCVESSKLAREISSFRGSAEFDQQQLKAALTSIYKQRRAGARYCRAFGSFLFLPYKLRIDTYYFLCYNLYIPEKQLFIKEIQ